MKFIHPFCFLVPPSTGQMALLNVLSQLQICYKQCLRAPIASRLSSGVWLARTKPLTYCCSHHEGIFTTTAPELAPFMMLHAYR